MLLLASDHLRSADSDVSCPSPCSMHVVLTSAQHLGRGASGGQQSESRGDRVYVKQLVPGSMHCCRARRCQSPRQSLQVFGLSSCWALLIAVALACIEVIHCQPYIKMAGMT